MKKQKNVKPLILTNYDEKTISEFVLNNRYTRIEVVSESIRKGVFLCQVKNSLKHGEFGKWVDENFGNYVSERSTRNYMKLASKFLDSEAAGDFLALGLDEQQAELFGDDDGVFMAAVEKFLRMD